MASRRRWTCPACKWRNEPGKSRTCVGCGQVTRPKRRVRKTDATLRDDSYERYREISEAIHGNADESCDVCGKPRPETRRHDRDHDHTTGLPRGLACGGNQGCNVLMPRWMTPAAARAIYDVKRRDGDKDAERWRMIACYLDRVEDYYARRLVGASA